MNSSWSRQLNRELKSLAKENNPTGGLPRIAFVGIGNEFKADDLAGPMVVRQLIASNGAHPGILILEAGSAPENVTSVLRRFEPDLVLLVDAVDMHQEPGSVAWLEFDALEDSNAFTHAPAPAMLGDYLKREFNCRIALIGIQPGSLEFDRPASSQVQTSARVVASEISQTLIEMGY